MGPKHRYRKRQQEWLHQEGQEEEPEVDDLSVAATFAQVSTFSVNQGLDGSEEKVKEDTIQASDDDTDSGSSDKDDTDSATAESDDESEVDLSDALARMTKEEDDNNDDEDAVPPTACNGGSSQAPVTEHEVDPYRTPLSDLEQKFQLNLTVAERERLHLDKETATRTSAEGAPVQLCVAGHVATHMVSDRTIVVQSVGGSAPLDEGSLVVVRVQDEGTDKKTPRLLALGKVFEVFGPVSRPLYTIRLPLAKKELPKKDKSVGNEFVVERDKDEISLNDDEAEKDGERTEDESIEVAASTESKQSDDGARHHDNSRQETNGMEVDPWAPKGKYTKLLESTSRMPVYYIPDVATLLDTGAVIRSSGRGCDASNLYDEEVINVNEMEFSDDEQEREFKSRNKRGRKGRRKRDDAKTSGADAGRGRGSSRPNYTGFHAQRKHEIDPPNQPVHHLPMVSEPIQYQATPGVNPHQYPPSVYPHAHQQQPVYAYAPQGYGHCPYPTYSHMYPQPPPSQYRYPYSQPQGPADPNQASKGRTGGDAADTVYYD